MNLKDIEKKIESNTITTKKFAELKPEYLEAFRNLNKEIYKESALSTKVKELAAVSVATSKRCESCLLAHINKALKAGATKEEIIEASLVATTFSGGPALGTVMHEVLPIVEFFSKK